VLHVSILALINVYRGGNIAFGTGAALGGLFGGVVNDTIGWRWAFIIQVSCASPMVPLGLGSNSE
jgi:MFS family permease